MLAALLVVAATSVAGAGPAAADAVDDLVERYRAVAGRHDDEAYASQRASLFALADVATPAARRALERLVAAERGAPGGVSDRRRLLLLLAALVRHGGPAEVDFAVRTVEAERDPFLVSSLARVLGEAQEPEARAHLRGPALARAVPAVKAQVARALGAQGDPEAVVALLAVLREDDVDVRVEALLALGELHDASAAAPMVAFLGSPDAVQREAAARALGVLGSARAVPALLAALADPAPRVVESAAGALGLLGSPTAVTPLIDRLAVVRGKDLRVEEALERALVRLTGKPDLGADPDLWRAWWAENRDRTAGPTSNPNAPTTVSGPRYYGFPVRSSRVVFVVDVSRSMGWNGRLELAQKELKEVIEHLPATTRFNLVAYSDTAEAWGKALVPATPENVRRAVRFVERLAPVGGTNIHDGLRLALADPDADTVFFLSDGTPTVGSVVDPDQILGEVRDTNRRRRVRIHTVALVRGDPPPRFAGQEDPTAAAEFMRRLADDNEGSTRAVR